MNLLELRDPRLDSFCTAAQNGQDLVAEGLWDSPKALLIAWAQRLTGKHILVINGATKEESRLYHDLRYLSDRPVLDFPAWETLPSENVPPSPDVVGERYQILGKIREADGPLTVMCSLQAYLQRLIPPEAFDSLHLTLRKGDEVPFDKLTDQLLQMGYRRGTVASDKGEFAVRGGIVDIFPVSGPDPYRIEFWGDDVESIRIFDPLGQKSVKPVDQVNLTPARELEFLADSPGLSGLADYLGPNTLVIFDDLLALEDRYVSMLNIPGTLSRSFASMEQLFEEIAPLQKMYWSIQTLEELSEVVRTDKKSENLYSATAAPHGVQFQIFDRKISANRWNHPFQSVVDFVHTGIETADVEIKGTDILHALSRVPRETQILFLSNTDSEERTLRSQLKEFGVDLPPNAEFQRGYLSSGLALPELPYLVIPLTEITGQHKIRRQKMRSTYHTVPSQMFELVPGDNVVHLNHGIGKFIGVDRRPNHEGIDTEFFLIEYDKEAKLFVPMTQSHLVSKYIGNSEDKILLHQIGSKKWQRQRATTEKAIMGYAADLLKLYAKRQMGGGHQFPADSEELQRFEQDFPFVETEDQVKAVEEIKLDMESERCMDRLICGDVGYGKTEVAMRAAFKAAHDGGKQVAVLVPTTVLAMQHYETFKQRMANYPVTIACLSRFASGKETKHTLNAIANGGVDIVIGTHRIVSKDVHFKDLGLVIVDEEQRFGVRAKEHLKKIRTGVDCLNMSATPIPRTLYMSLLGARDMSVISTPPQDRLPIKTIIAELNDDILRNALLRELNRDGQAFVVHNRVESIDRFAHKLQKLLPQARIIVGHGQMSAEEIDRVFHLFKQGDADILVATTIVENGIDIPNANTILVDRAERFGISGLYQLRGRVGRWNRQAYAYFLVPKKREVPELALKRLQALGETGGYGGGMKLAMRDLEIRGAGDILGTEQSGQVAAVGFHFYCKMLKRTIETLKGEAPSTIVDTRVEFPIDARLPEEYVNAPSLRMEIYQRLGEAITTDDVDTIWNELKDRFGAPPMPVRWLYHLSRIRVFASRNSFSLLRLNRTTLTVERQLGKKEVTKQIIFRRPEKPAELEARVIGSLKKAFKIK